MNLPASLYSHMLRFSKVNVLSLAAVGLLACNAPSPPPPAPTVESALPAARLNSLLERYWAEKFARPGVEAPDVSAQALADSLAAERRYLAEITAISRALLDPDARVTYDIFLRDRQLAIQGFTYPAELLPVNPYDSEAQRFALAAASDRVEDWQRAADAFERWSVQAIANMREGLRRGYVMPRSAVEQTLPWLAALGSDSASNPFANVPVKSKVQSAYRALHDFMQHEYLPRSRSSAGLSALPLGDAWYAYVVKRETGTEMSPKAVHDFGVAEVERLRGRMQALLAETAYAGNIAGFLDAMRRDSHSSPRSAENLLMAYGELKVQVAQSLPSVVGEVPKADFEIRPVEAYAQAFAPTLSYRHPEPGTQGVQVLYVNVADLEAHPASALAARFLREALPGRHLQWALQEERSSWPKYRRFVGNPGFIEGWEMYAVSLGEELGVYRDAEAKFGALWVEMECAGTLVADTGLHALGWTRQQALDYLHALPPIEDAEAAKLVDTAIAVPGDRLGCASSVKFRALRGQAEKFLGVRFNLSAFNSALIEEGAIPLDLLEARLKHWQEAQAAAAAVAPAAAAAAAPAAAASAAEPRADVR